MVTVLLEYLQRGQSGGSPDGAVAGQMQPGVFWRSAREPAFILRSGPSLSSVYAQSPGMM